MKRVILYSGKGGVGKTTVSAATAVACAEMGRRTLIISFDLAHSLSDSFDLDRNLFDQNRGNITKIMPCLHMQEIDVQEELERHWGEVFRYMSALLSQTGMSNVMAEEVALLPGMEDVILLLYLNSYIKSDEYEVIVVDCPPTGDSVRFISMTTTLEWYMNKRFGIDRNILKLARPIAKLANYGALPEDTYFESIRQLYRKIEGVDLILRDPKMTTVRLVTNAEKMVVRETQRAFMFFNMYGVTTDAVIVNRLFSEGNETYGNWANTHRSHLLEIEECFSPIPVKKIPLFPDEVLGIDKLHDVAGKIFVDTDPAAIMVEGTTFDFIKDTSGVYSLNVKMPFIRKQDVDLSRQDDMLLIRVGSFKRHIPLPRNISRLTVQGAKMEDGKLIVVFK